MDISWTKELNKILEKKGFINISHEALDVHIGTDVENKVALRFVKNDWPQNNNSVQDITYKELLNDVKRCSSALKKLGIKKGDAIFSLSPRFPESYILALSTFRTGGVYSPLFSAFGPEPIEARFNKGQGKVLFTLSSYYYKKIEPIRHMLTSLQFLVILDDDGMADKIPNCINLKKLMVSGDEFFDIEKTAPDDLALLHFTSGTTGTPKGAMHVHKAVVYHKLSGQWALDFKTDFINNDVFWCTADPGWITGTSYGLISPLCNGQTLLIDQAEFSAERWYNILQSFKVSIWYTAPTALRMLMRSGVELPKKYNFKSMRFAASVGEPLNPEIIYWARENLGISIHDNWWQTETGGILIANSTNVEIKPGSMGKVLPGIMVSVVKIKDDKLEEIKSPTEEGQLAIRKGWPSMFIGYLGDEQKYSKCFIGEWYLTGDLVKKDSEEYFWFIGRADDVIKTAGHLVGPFEIESVLMEHPSVLEAAVIGIPDTIAGEMVKGFVVLKKDIISSDDLGLDILAYSRKRLGVAISPKKISFINNLPKTKSGKIMRRLLKARELGLPEGDLSMLEMN